MIKRGPLLLLAFLYLALLISVLCTFRQLPEPVATHFTAQGHPDGWMHRSKYLLATVALSLWLPALVVGLCFALRFAPNGAINLPRKEYWLAPERREQTCNYFLYQSIWFACMAVAFVIGIHFSVVQANSGFPRRLSDLMVLAVAGSFLVGVIAWALHLIAPFLRDPPEDKA